MSSESHDASRVTHFAGSFSNDPFGSGCRMAGDWYRESDQDVYRGLSLPFSDDDGAMPFSMPHCAAAGDFYGERKEVTRGVTFHLSSDALMGFSQIDDKQHELGNLKSNHAAVHKHAREFDPAHVPPPLEQEVADHLLATKVELSQSSPVRVGNTLLIFLTEKIDARVNKVNIVKYTIRAEAILDGLAFVVKIRLYQKETATVVEFQRRSGDSVAFNKFYHKASAYLHGRPDDQWVQDCWSFCQTPLQVAPVSPKDAIAPLIDMAHLNPNPILLAEVASALCAMAKQDRLVAEELQKPCGLAVLEQLEKYDDFSVSFPTHALRRTLLGY